LPLKPVPVCAAVGELFADLIHMHLSRLHDDSYKPDNCHSKHSYLIAHLLQ